MKWEKSTSDAVEADLMSDGGIADRGETGAADLSNNREAVYNVV